MTKLRELEKRLRDEPDNLGLRVLVAAAMREAGRNTDAVELYRSVAIAYRDQGRGQQAIAVCKSILDIAPDDAISKNLLAQLVANQPRARESSSVDAAVLDIPSITPPPPPSNPPTTPPPPLRPQTARPPAPPRARTPAPLPAAPAPSVPARRSSFGEETPLPKPLPYHVADPTTSSLQKMSAPELPSEDADTRPSGPKTARGSDVDGLAAAARRISASLIAAGRSVTRADEDDISIELETRRLPRIDTRELQKIAAPPPTVPTERVSPIALDDELPTASRAALGNEEPTDIPIELDTEDELTSPVDLPAGTKPPPLKKR